MTCRLLLLAFIVILAMIGASTPVQAAHLSVLIDPDDGSSQFYARYQKTVFTEYPEGGTVRDRPGGQDLHAAGSEDSSNPGTQDLMDQTSQNVPDSVNRASMPDLDASYNVHLRPFYGHALDGTDTASVAATASSGLDEWVPHIISEFDYIFLALTIFIYSLFPFWPLPSFLLLVPASVGDRFDLHVLAFLSAATMTATKQVFFLVSYDWRKIITQKTKNRMRPFERLMKRYGAAVAFLAAVMPVFDDLVYVLLGLAKYSRLRFLAAIFAGKLVLSYAVVFASHYLGRSLFDPLTENIDLATPFYAGFIPFGVSVTVMVVLLLRLDWKRVLGRRAPWTLDENNPDDGRD